MKNAAKSFTKAQYITYCALFCALGALLPQAFHAFGNLSGTIFLPMHIPAMAAGFLLGPLAGLITGILSPLLSCLITVGTMPIPIKMPFMMFEIGTYGVVCGVLYRLFAVFVCRCSLNPFSPCLARRLPDGLSICFARFLR